MKCTGFSKYRAFSRPRCRFGFGLWKSRNARRICRDLLEQCWNGHVNDKRPVVGVVAAEVVVFFIIGPALLRWIGPRGAAALAAVAGSLYAGLLQASPPLSCLLSIVQPLHGLTFALLHLACMRLMVVLFQSVWPQRLKLFTHLAQVSRYCSTDFLVRNSICEVRRNGILPNGCPLRYRTPGCLVRLFRGAGFIARHRLINAVPPPALQLWMPSIDGAIRWIGIP